MPCVRRYDCWGASLSKSDKLVAGGASRHSYFEGKTLYAPFPLRRKAYQHY